MGFNFAEPLSETAALMRLGLWVALLGSCGGHSVPFQSNATPSAGSTGASSGGDADAGGGTAATAGASAMADGGAGATGGVAGVAPGGAAGGGAAGGGAAGGGGGSGASDASGSTSGGAGPCNECLPCPLNTTAYGVAGECCPRCMPVAACVNGRAKYAIESEALLSKSSLACMSDMDCAVLLPVTRCGQDCGYRAVSTSAGNDLGQALSELGESDCAGCVAGTASVCPPRPPAACVGSVCVLAQ
jgi:hypothetical protein